MQVRAHIDMIIIESRLMDRIKDQITGSISFAAATDAELYRRLGNVREGPGYKVFSCSRNPSFRWGNRIHFGSLDKLQDVRGCERIMTDEFAGIAGITHNAFSWDVASYDEPALEIWRSQGYEVDFSDTLVMTQRPMRRIKPPCNLIIRPLASNSDWLDACECQVLVRPAHWCEEDSRS